MNDYAKLPVLEYLIFKSSSLIRKNRRQGLSLFALYMPPSLTYRQLIRSKRFNFANYGNLTLRQSKLTLMMFTLTLQFIVITASSKLLDSVVNLPQSPPQIHTALWNRTQEVYKPKTIRNVGLSSLLWCIFVQALFERINRARFHQEVIHACFQCHCSLLFHRVSRQRHYARLNSNGPHLHYSCYAVCSRTDQFKLVLR